MVIEYLLFMLFFLMFLCCLSIIPILICNIIYAIKELSKK